jgi:NAD(P)H-nitrite reductase large subunit
MDDLSSRSNGVLVIGASAAGLSSVKEFRQLDNTSPVTIISEESYRPYYRPMLTEYIGDTKVLDKPNFYLQNEVWFAEKKINLVNGDRVTGIDLSSKRVKTASGRVFEYFKLIFACGSSCIVPDKSLKKKNNVYTIRNLDDAKRLVSNLDAAKKIAIIGGGLLGLEAAYSLSKHGHFVSVIEISDRILPKQLDADGSMILEKIIRKFNINLIFKTAVKAVLGEQIAEALLFESGEELAIDILIYSIGVKPNAELAKEAGIEIGRGIVVNERMETSVRDVYACGDAAEFNGNIPALWMPAIKQGRVAGINASGGNAVYKDEVYPALLNSFATRVYSIGNVNSSNDEGIERISAINASGTDNYKKLYFADDRLSGFILIGDIKDSKKLSDALISGADYNAIKKELPL